MTTKITQRLGFPNASIRLYENYDNWLDSKFVEMGATFISMTLRDGLYGSNEGLLSVYDITNMHTHMTGDEIIEVKIGNNNAKYSRQRIYAIKHFSVSVDDKNDNVLTFQLSPYHINKNIKFGRTFFSNASDTIQTMLNAIYSDMPLLIPVLNSLNVYVPKAPWTSTLEDYMNFVRDIGLAVESEQFPFLWEDFNGINFMDYNTMINQDPINFIVGDPKTVGIYADGLKYPLAFDFEWRTRSNSHTRNPISDSTIFSHSLLDQNVTRISNGTAENSILVSRSGAYSDMIFRNGYEEALRILTMSQYDGYAKATIYGNFDITPGLKIQFYDSKNQMLNNFYVDEVIHEISMETSYTNMYMFTNSKELETITPIKVKNELKNDSSDEESTN